MLAQFPQLRDQDAQAVDRILHYVFDSDMINRKTWKYINHSLHAAAVQHDFFPVHQRCRGAAPNRSTLERLKAMLPSNEDANDFSRVTCEMHFAGKAKDRKTRAT